MSAPDRVPIVLTLVHGTWGRGFFRTTPPDPSPSNARWFEPGSAFREELDRRLAIGNFLPSYDDFGWSGANSIMERDEAARSLAGHLRRQNEAFPGQKRVVIAHSHGGSVAMRSLCHLHDDKETNPVLVVTMATPFIQMFLQYPESLANKSYQRLAILAWFTFLLLALLTIAWLVGGFGGGTSVVVPGACLLLSCLGVLSTPWILLGKPWFGDVRSERVLRLVKSCMVPPGKMAPHKLLVLRGVEDEAGLGLALGAVGARATYLLAKVGAQLQSSLWVLAVLGIIVLAELYLKGHAGVITVSAFGILGAALILITAALLVCVACKAAHGRELLAGGLVCEVGSASVPDSGTKNLWVATLPIQMERARGQPWRHALYDNTFCCRMIEDWLHFSTDDFGRKPQSLHDLRFLMDFLYESPQEGLVKFGEALRASWEKTSNDIAEMERIKLELFGTDEEWAELLRDAKERMAKLSKPTGSPPG